MKQKTTIKNKVAALWSLFSEYYFPLRDWKKRQKFIFLLNFIISALVFVFIAITASEYIMLAGFLAFVWIYTGWFLIDGVINFFLRANHVVNKRAEEIQKAENLRKIEGGALSLSDEKMSGSLAIADEQKVKNGRGNNKK